MLNKDGESSATSVSSIDIHDFARTCAFYDVAPVYIIHPAAAMQSFVHELTGHWLKGKRGTLNPGRREVMQQIKVVADLRDVFKDEDYQLWYTSAEPPEGAALVSPASLCEKEGKHLIVFGTGHGLDVNHLPAENGWLFSIEGMGKVRHLSVRAALAIYLDRLSR
ncbi:MAG: RNA methyltransferase [Mariprofundaceae bacterium]|nr:RNA methyltransferase [Mariprofundaceae bacterium]